MLMAARRWWSGERWRQESACARGTGNWGRRCFMNDGKAYEQRRSGFKSGRWDQTAPSLRSKGHRQQAFIIRLTWAEAWAVSDAPYFVPRSGFVRLAQTATEEETSRKGFNHPAPATVTRRRRRHPFPRRPWPSPSGPAAPTCNETSPEAACNAPARGPMEACELAGLRLLTWPWRWLTNSGLRRQP